MKRAVRNILFPLFLSLLSVPFCSTTQAEKLQEISAPEVKNMLENDQTVLVNVLSRIEYEMQHIPNSINIPISDMKTTVNLPENKATSLIFYGMGKRCPYALRAARIAAQKGYTDIHVFTGGIPEWRKFCYSLMINPTWQKIKVKKIPPKDFRALIKDRECFILDVRTLNSEKNPSFINDSVLCPLVYLVDRYRQIPADHPVAITDWAMKQSPVAAKFLISKGYTVAGVLKGGTKRWESEKFPVEAQEPLTLRMPLSTRKRGHTH